MLEVRNLSKSFKKNGAVSHLSMKAENGIYGLLGANGSGKTTLLRMIATVLAPDEGEILFDGKSIEENRTEYLKQIGYMPQHLGLFPGFTVTEFLEYMAALKGLDPKWSQKKIEELLTALSLQEQKKKKIRQLSGGMKQRVGIAQALLNEPKLLILDEPSAGLDPKERIQLSSLLARLARNRIILLSTHIVSDMQSHAKTILLMKKGEIQAQGTLEELTEPLKGKVFEADLSYEQADRMHEEVIVCSEKETDQGVRIRFLDPDHCFLYPYHVVEPDLNDVYLWAGMEEDGQ